MNRIHSVLLVIITLIAACTQEQVDFESLQNRNGIYYQVNQDEPFSGSVYAVDSSTQVRQEGAMKTGLREGEWVGTYPNGQVQYTGVYKDGQKDGTWTYWQENGEKDRDEIYSKGERLGDFAEEEEQQAAEEEKAAEEKEEESKPQAVDFKRLVNIKIDGHYRKSLDGVPYTGPVVKYYRHGQVELRGFYRKGLRNGKWTYYRENGVVKNVKHFDSENK